MTPSSKPIILLRLEDPTQHQKTVEAIKAQAPSYEVIDQLLSDPLEPWLDRLEILCNWNPNTVLNPSANEILEQCPQLRWIQSGGAGSDWTRDLGPHCRSQVTVTSASGIHPVPIAEHVFGLLLTWTRRLHWARDAQNKKEYLKVPHPDLSELEGKHLLILGMGRVGERCAALAQAFGMQVTGLRRNPEKISTPVHRKVAVDQLYQVLPQADYVLGILPNHKTTHHFLDATAIALMKPGAFFCNVGRGQTVDQEALVEALQSGKLAGAALDVFEEEPLPEDSPLWSLPNVLITGHYAGATHRYDHRLLDLFSENLRHYLQSEKMNARVQPPSE